MVMKNYPFVIGIGASARGLHALKDFFSARQSTSGESYVVILHSARSYESQLLLMLSGVTTLKVVWLIDNMLLEADTVYIGPPGYKVAIVNHTFILVERQQDEVINQCIDYFFSALGREVKDKAIGIILSGTESDGTEGARVIEENAGIIIAQDPATAKIDETFQASIPYHHPDYVRAPQEMPALIDVIIGGREDKTERRRRKLS